MVYNANMLNILHDQFEYSPKKKALMDLNAISSQSSFYDRNWRNPRLDSSTGFHNANNRGGADFWVMVELPGVFRVHEMLLMKRGDNGCRDRLILQLNIKYTEDNINWIEYNNGLPIPTG